MSTLWRANKRVSFVVVAYAVSPYRDMPRFAYAIDSWYRLSSHRTSHTNITEATITLLWLEFLRTEAFRQGAIKQRYQCQENMNVSKKVTSFDTVLDDMDSS